MDSTKHCIKQHLIKLKNVCGIKRHLSATANAAPSEQADFKKTVFLPKTTFPPHLKCHERSANDAEIYQRGKFDSFYEWQRNAKERQNLPEYVLLDGPPYANGSTHVGHAINKVLKDFIVKTRIPSHRVHFQPGWDCHGLPIELKIAKEESNSAKSSPLRIRELARQVANNAISTQKSSFKRWGVTADWSNPYLTMDPKYVANQLDVFATLFEKGYVYRSFKPIYWSPSSKSALAESELEYNDKHKSIAAFFRFQMINLSLETLGLASLESSKKPSHIFALIWTTTPWTLPLNDAVAYSENLQYAIVEFEDAVQQNLPIKEYYIVAANLVSSISQTLQRPLKIVSHIESSVFKDVFYRHCFYNNVASPFVPASHVSASVGTGLVHTSYAHGFDDYKIAVARDEKVQCFVDEEGKYTRQMGYDLEGKDVITQGSKAVLQLLKKNVIHSYNFVHSYPYDWRTKKPVIIRSSKQWFIDVSEVSQKAVEMIEKQLLIDENQKASLTKQLSHRPAWCISRQRAWGVPIPALINSKNDAYMNSQFIKSIADNIRQTGDTDYWWKVTVADLLKSSQSLNLPADDHDIQKGSDIMDVWLDSGVAWHTIENGNAADCISEGVDQFRGWFQSLLLTSIAARDLLPYKHVIVHGFSVDDKNRKMSKSVGNVIDPDWITDGTMAQKALGADGLRLWVALYGSEGTSDVKLGPLVLNELELKLKQIRLIYKFLLGALDGYNGEKPKELRLLDKFILDETKQFSEKALYHYSQYRFRAVANEFIQFLNNPLSSIYVNCVRDRLYCDPLNSDSRISALYTIDLIGRKLTDIMSPLLPHLATEYCIHHPQLKDEPEKAIRQQLSLEFPHFNDYCETEKEVFVLILNLRYSVLENAGNKFDMFKMGIEIQATENDYMKLLSIQGEPESVSSQLTEIFGCSYLKISKASESKTIAQVMNSPRKHCIRCRKIARLENDRLCFRCQNSVSTLI